jgi:NADH dehydrogenase
MTRRCDRRGLAAQLVQLTQAAASYGAEPLPNRVTITLVESGPRLLPGFPEDISGATEQRLRALGVQVRLASRVAAADAEGVTLNDGVRVEAQLKVWAAGVKGPDVLASLDGLEHNKTQQLCVRPSLQTTVDADIYAIGDCAGLTPPGETRPLPPTAQVAHQQALHLIRHSAGRSRPAQPCQPSRIEISARWSRWGTTTPLGRSATSASSRA